MWYSPSRGGSQLVVHSVCESRKMSTSPLASRAPASRALMSPDRWVKCITRTLGRWASRYSSSWLFRKSATCHYCQKQQRKHIIIITNNITTHLLQNKGLPQTLSLCCQSWGAPQAPTSSVHLFLWHPSLIPEPKFSFRGLQDEL